MAGQPHPESVLGYVAQSTHPRCDLPARFPSVLVNFAVAADRVAERAESPPTESAPTKGIVAWIFCLEASAYRRRWQGDFHIADERRRAGTTDQPEKRVPAFRKSGG
jgi:hypothetical protein